MSTLRVLAVLQVSQKVDPVEDVDEGEEIGGMRRRVQGGGGQIIPSLTGFTI